MSLIIGISSICYIFILGFNNLTKTLGSASFLPVVLVGLAILLVKAKKYHTHLLLCIFFVITLIISNHIIQHIVTHRTFDSINILAIYIVGLTIGITYIAYMFLISAAMKKIYNLSGEDKKIIRGFNLAIGYPFIFSCMVISPLVLNASSFYWVCVISFLPFAFSSITNYWLLTLLKDSEMDYLLVLDERYPASASVYKLLVFILFLIGLLSLAFEYFRGMWIYGILNVIFFLSTTLGIHSVFRNIFRVKVDNPQPSRVLNALRLSNKWFSVLIITFIVVIIYVIVYAFFSS
jgi:hypothetical protein